MPRDTKCILTEKREGKKKDSPPGEISTATANGLPVSVSGEENKTLLAIFPYAYEEGELGC